MADETPKKKAISVRGLSEELHTILRLYAAQHRTSVDKVALAAIEFWWSQQPEKELYARLAAQSKAAPEPKPSPKGSAKKLR